MHLISDALESIFIPPENLVIPMDKNIIELFTKFIENRQTFDERLRVISLLELGENMEEWKIVVTNMHDIASEGTLRTGMTQNTFKKISERIKRRKIKSLP